MPTRFDPLSTIFATSRRYRLLGVVVLIVLALIALGTGSYLLFVDGAPAGLTTILLALVVVCALLSFGLLYVLFTIEQTFKTIRTSILTKASPSPRLSWTPLAATTAPVAAPTIEYGRESRDVEILEGIGTVFSRRLARNGIATLDDLRNASVTTVAVAAQVGEPIAHRWKLMAELMSVRALDAQAAELLVLCGIESVEELAQETAESLVRKARLVNQSHKARIYPAELSVGTVEGWIQAAKAQAIPGKVSERQRFGRGKTPA